MKPISDRRIELGNILQIFVRELWLSTPLRDKRCQVSLGRDLLVCVAERTVERETRRARC